MLTTVLEVLLMREEGEERNKKTQKHNDVQNKEYKKIIIRDTNS